MFFLHLLHMHEYEILIPDFKELTTSKIFHKKKKNKLSQLFAHIVLCFRFVTERALTEHWCCYWTMLTEKQGLLCFSLCPTPASRFGCGTQPGQLTPIDRRDILPQNIMFSIKILSRVANAWKTGYTLVCLWWVVVFASPLQHLHLLNCLYVDLWVFLLLPFQFSPPIPTGESELGGGFSWQPGSTHYKKSLVFCENHWVLQYLDEEKLRQINYITSLN